MTAPVLRADAARNRERIITAARELFSERGLEASVAEIAERAGVGKATVFRSYPSKEQLIAAVACERVQWVEATIEQALQREDAWAAFEDLLVQLARRHAHDLTHLEALSHDEITVKSFVTARAAANDALARLMDRARGQGTMRSDATPDDVRVLFHGVTSALRDDERRRDPDSWARWAQLFASALRA